MVLLQTTNLDGESNLKVRFVVDRRAQLIGDLCGGVVSCRVSQVRSAPECSRGLTTADLLSEFRGVVRCSAPNDKLYKFDSQLRVVGVDAVIPLSSDNLLLQATHVRNTAFVFGLVVYTGE